MAGEDPGRSSIEKQAAPPFGGAVKEYFKVSVYVSK